MSWGRTGFVVPILAVAAFAAMLGVFAWNRQRIPVGPEIAAGRVGEIAARNEAPAGPPPAAEPAAPASLAPAALASLPEAASTSPSLPGAGVPAAVIPPAGGPAALVPAAPAAAPSAAARAPAAEPATAVAAPAPAFDVVRVEPSGETVIAGRAPPGWIVMMFDNGREAGRVVADEAGQFVLIPEALGPGSHEITLRGIGKEGRRGQSAQSVTVVVAARRDTAPLVTVAAPGEPTRILSGGDEPVRVAAAPQPPAVSRSPGVATPPALAPEPAARLAAAPSPTAILPSMAAVTPSGPSGPTPPSAAGPAPSPAVAAEVRIASVETAAAGRLYVSGVAAPGATVRLYLNDTFVAPGSPSADGRLAFSIERGIEPGSYRVRLDEVDPITGAVRSRAEVPFVVPPAQLASVEPKSVETVSAEPPRPPERPATLGGLPATPAPALQPPTLEPSATVATRAVAVPPVVAPSEAGVAPREAVVAVAAATGGEMVATPVPAGPATVVIAQVSTHKVVRGDHLWRISTRVYGEGVRYTVIYGANTPQIRNPNLIYPGQVFVLPASESAASR